ncbi:STAS domain-containing protein [Methylobacterium sp. E-041]|jgi:rsbT co-antagonist protein RsbR|uniref:STAS domain-containing protein n=1 Tax=unclassified Methylobacterium TaxID=2615210 RepID=UPI001FBA298A|nr:MULTISPECIES: STAS domain-containing protein [unclassified Methylobacterium]MCJ2008061.1 STAS domain-containing protein [Methylobacterium sp. J-092]MCJ2042790.1 STAS domain-containing protein [Methylobacterium sp. J-059]MCJ2075162.1 STAS domain-containing protein [Methylobacterium sp. E-016]MCJ2108364.1 STAS domain-containing protein [Methylobacterium sp. E-041]MCJ2114956.1 STAS domain-containing protein [Methylobacterium sp. E-025]
MTRIDGAEVLKRTLADDEAAILDAWTVSLREGTSLQSGRIREAELQTQARAVYRQLRDAFAAGGLDADAEGFAQLRDTLADISRSRAIQGFTPTDTANFVYSLKPPVFEALEKAHATDAATLAAGTRAASRVLDRLGLHTMEVFLASREEVIGRQGQEIAELSTPVVRLWDGILALPLIGTLDSARTGVVMENLLQAIVDEEAEIAIIDITGVPTVDTLVAQHLLKTVAAARLMGADCIVSGIRPQIAQTMVHLGVELNVVSKATLADAFAVALRRTGRKVVRQQASIEGRG